MSTKVSTIEYIEDQLADVPGVRSRKMFGEYALYVGDKVVALVCDDTLFVKITEEGRAFVGDAYEEACAYPDAKPSMRIDEDMIEDHVWLCELVRITETALPPPKPKRKNNIHRSGMKKRSSASGMFVALIRGINVGGKNKVKMENLRTACEEVGLEDVATFIQSGNVVFRSDKGVEALRGIFVNILEKEFSVKTETVVIAADGYRSIVEHFPKEFSMNEERKDDVLFLGSTDAASEIAKEFGGQAKGLNVSSFGQAVYWSRDREDGEPDRYIRKLLAHKLYKQMTIRNSRTTRSILDLF